MSFVLIEDADGDQMLINIHQITVMGFYTDEWVIATSCSSRIVVSKATYDTVFDLAIKHGVG